MAKTAYSVREQANGFFIVRPLVQYGSQAFEYWPSTNEPAVYATREAAQSQIDAMVAQLNRQDRMNALADKAMAGTITPAERAELNELDELDAQNAPDDDWLGE